MEMHITKKMLEDFVQFKIEDFKLKPIYVGDECIGLDVSVIPKVESKYIKVEFKIEKDSNNGIHIL